MCHVSAVTCHLSPVMCHLSHVKKKLYIYFFLFLQKKLEKVVELVGGGSVINGAYTN